MTFQDRCMVQRYKKPHNYMIISNLHRNYCFLFVNFIKYLYVVQQAPLLCTVLLQFFHCFTFYQ